MKNFRRILCVIMIIALFANTVYVTQVFASTNDVNGRYNFSVMDDFDSEGFYLNSKNVLYYKYFKNSFTKLAGNISKIESNGSGCYAITTKGKLYYYHLMRDSSWKSEYIMSGVKELADSSPDIRDGFLALKRNGEVWKITRSNLRPGVDPVTFKTKKIASNAKKVYNIYNYPGDNYYVLKKDNSLWGFGKNLHGELGIGSTNEVTKLRKIMENVKSFYWVDHFGMGDNGHTCYAIKDNGKLYAWGKNDEDEIPYEAFQNANQQSTEVVTNPLCIMDGVKSIDGYQCYVTALKKDGSLWGWGKYVVYWEDLTAFTDVMSLTQLADNVKSAGTILYKGSNIVYYLDKNNTLWARFMNKLDQAPMKCMKNVKSMDYRSQVLVTNSGKIYFCTANAKSKYLLKKVLIAKGV